MSADAKMWISEKYTEHRDAGRYWIGVHDGSCAGGDGYTAHQEPQHMGELVSDIETCMGGRALRWEFRELNDGEPILFGYEV